MLNGSPSSQAVISRRRVDRVRELVVLAHDGHGHDSTRPATTTTPAIIASAAADVGPPPTAAPSARRHQRRRERQGDDRRQHDYPQVPEQRQDRRDGKHANEQPPRPAGGPVKRRRHRPDPDAALAAGRGLRRGRFRLGLGGALVYRPRSPTSVCHCARLPRFGDGNPAATAIRRSRRGAGTLASARSGGAT